MMKTCCKNARIDRSWLLNYKSLDENQMQFYDRQTGLEVVKTVLKKMTKRQNLIIKVTYISIFPNTYCY